MPFGEILYAWGTYVATHFRYGALIFMNEGKISHP